MFKNIKILNLWKVNNYTYFHSWSLEELLKVQIIKDRFFLFLFFFYIFKHKTMTLVDPDTLSKKEYTQSL